MVMTFLLENTNYLNKWVSIMNLNSKQQHLLSQHMIVKAARQMLKYNVSHIEVLWRNVIISILSNTSMVQEFTL